MLESIRLRTQDFDQVTKKYTEIRNAFEELLVKRAESDESLFYITTKRDVEYQGVPLQISVSVKVFDSEIKNNKDGLKHLSDLTINVNIENVASGIREDQELLPVKLINADPKNVSANNLTVAQANNIVKNLEGITSLLAAPKTN